MVLTKETITRIANDVKYILKNPLDNNGIYYMHDEENILKGYALIIGNKDSPYAYGNYLFEFNFTENYPYEPPIVTYLTNDGIMRFNPNLYISGYVCLSILNTWNGEGWTSCQTITSILLSLMLIFNESPLKNEPGINEHNPNIKTYNEMVKYKNIEFAIIKQNLIIQDLNNDLNNDLINIKGVFINRYHKCLLLFNEQINDNLKNNYDLIKENIELLKNICLNNNYLTISIYNLKFNIDFIKLKNDFIKL